MTQREKKPNLDPEIMLLDDVQVLLHQQGFSIPRIWAANFFVAFKSKPLMLLIGPPEAEKEMLVECFGKVLTGGDSYQFQSMIGHPWWASKTREVATYTQTQSRFNTFKLELMIEEAGQPGNQDRLFIANISQISPGELHEYFSETAFQLRHGQLMRLPTSHFSDPIPFPPNLAIIGTMNTLGFRWSDADLLSQTSIIDCVPMKMTGYQTDVKVSPDRTRVKHLTLSFIRDPQPAFRKVMEILRRFPAALFPLLQVQQILQKIISRNMLLEGMIYLSNSWSQKGLGLFDENPQKNLQIAMDLAITQSLLFPCREEIADSDNLRGKLRKILGDQYPLARGLLG